MSFRWLVIARTLHVLALIFWIGGVATVTTVILPTIRSFDSVEHKLFLSHQVEQRFRPLARIGWMTAGLSGLYMVYALHGWNRFEYLSFWWMHAMVALWIFFGLLLFVIEPFIIGPRMERRLAASAQDSLTRIELLHWIVLLLSLFTVVGAVIGSHGGL